MSNYPDNFSDVLFDTHMGVSVIERGDLHDGKREHHTALRTIDICEAMKALGWARRERYADTIAGRVSNSSYIRKLSELRDKKCGHISSRTALTIAEAMLEMVSEREGDAGEHAEAALALIENPLEAARAALGEDA